MAFKDFLNPRPRKFIIPLVLIVLFFVSLGFFYYSASPMDRLYCDYMETLSESEKAIQANDTFSAWNEFERINSLQAESAYLQGSVDTWFLVTGPFIVGLALIDPFMPFPCEFESWRYHPLQECTNYMSKETHECIVFFDDETAKINSNSGQFNMRLAPEYRTYRPVTMTRIMINITYLFVVGYLLSCIITLLWNKAKKKVSQITKEK